MLNVFIPPVVASLRLPFTLALGFLLAIGGDAVVLLLAAEVSDSAFDVDSVLAAILASLIIAAVSIALEVILGVNDDDTYALRVMQRIARRTGERTVTDVPGIVYLEIDGLALPVLRRAMRDGSAPELARWVQEGTHRLDEWETDLSSQTGASQAGILLGSNHDIPAFRWVEKETATLMTCSAPPDCAEIERRHSSGQGLLRDGGASRGNLLSGEAEHVDPDHQPARSREEGQPRLPAVPGQRLQRDAHPRPLHLGGRPRVDGVRAGSAPRRAARAGTAAAPTPSCAAA